ncbi:MAG: DNA repair protein RecN [Candidatus Krumholzibacteriia bacterium]
MLSELRIGRLAIVDELTIPFGPGLTVLTGETGAGKSLVAGALALLCGGAVPKGLIREGEECGWIEGVFDLGEAPAQREAMARAGVRVGSDGILVLRRELRLQGRSRVLINGLVSSVALLEQIGPRLLTIQSQDQQRELAEAAFARDLLDELIDAGALREAVQEAWGAFRAAEQALADRRGEEAAAAGQFDLWSYQLRELTEAALQEGEEEALAEELVVKRHAGALQGGCEAALERLDGAESPAREDLGAAVSALRTLAGKSRRVAEALADLEGAEDALAGAVTKLRHFLDALDLDAAGLDTLEARKALYEELRRKYRRDTAGLLDLRDELQERVARRDTADRDLARLAAAVEADRGRLGDAVAALHDRRVKQAPAVARRAVARIRPLALPALELVFTVTPRAAADGPVELAGQRCAAGPDGADRVTLQVRTNRGERMGEAGAIASGGERSRIYLGLTSLRRGGREPGLLLCDEIDAGLGMDAARPVAQLLRELAAAGPVVCITHLPTLAVFGDAHLCAAKTERDGRTVLTITAVAGEARVVEIARLLGGEGAGAAAAPVRRSYAEALLAQAGRE